MLEATHSSPSLMQMRWEELQRSSFVKSLASLVDASSFWHFHRLSFRNEPGLVIVVPHLGSWQHIAVLTGADLWCQSFCVLIQTIGGSPENFPISAVQTCMDDLLLQCSTSSHPSTQVFRVLVSVCMRGWGDHNVVPCRPGEIIIVFLKSGVTVI